MALPRFGPATGGDDGASRTARERAGGEWIQRGGAAALRVATRRSRFVNLMKIALPGLAMLLTVAVLAWPQLRRTTDEFRLSFSSLEADNGALTMAKARYHGVDAKGQPYVVTADSATQDLQDRDRIDLTNLTADITTNQGEWFTLSSDSGIYREDTQRLFLAGNITIFTDLGYEFHGDRADVDLDAGTVASDDMVWGQGPFGLIQAEGLRAYDGGDRIRFIKNVHTTLYPGPRS
ncbi:MAG: LPS export ABC transporter periplasmic protein LptC [Sneathiellaceae bacterium]